MIATAGYRSAVPTVGVGCPAQVMMLIASFVAAQAVCA
jgi:hypothetical protein